MERRLIYLQRPDGMPSADDMVSKLENANSLGSSSKALDKSKLSANERSRLSKGLTNTKELAKEQDDAKRDLQQMKDQLVFRDQKLELQDFNKFKQERNLDKIESPEELRKAIRALKELPGNLEKAKKAKQETAQEDSKELKEDAPERMEFKKEMMNILEKNSKLVHNPDEYKTWIEEQAGKKEATVGKFKKLKEDFEGINSKDPNGLHERREVYKGLEEKFKKYAAGKPEDSPIIGELNLKERKEFSANIKELESVMSSANDKLYTHDATKKFMQGGLASKSLLAQKTYIQDVKNFKSAESQAFTHLDDKMTLEGVTIRKMSNKGKDQLIDYYSGKLSENAKPETILKQRSTNVNQWETFVEAEAGLAEDMLAVYTEDGKVDKEGFRLAMGSFEEMSYDEKEKAVDEHKQIVKENKDTEVRNKKLTEMAIVAKVGEAKRNKFICEKTALHYATWAKNPASFKDPVTKKPGSLKEMDRYYKLLIQDQPYIKGDEKNIAAFKVERGKFETDLRKLRTINPKLEDEGIKDWQEKYDKETWEGRKDIHDELIAEQETEKENAQRNRRLNETAPKKAEKKEAAESIQQLKQVVVELAHNEQGREAEIQLGNYIDSLDKEERKTFHKSPDYLFLKAVVDASIANYGFGEVRDEDNTEQIQEIEDTVEETFEDNAVVQDTLLESYLEERFHEGVQKNVDRHGKVQSVEERAEKETLQGMTGTEAELAKDFYENRESDSNVILDKEGEAKEVKKIKLEGHMNNTTLQSMKSKMANEDQTKIDVTKEGVSDVEFTVNGQEVTTQQAEKKIDERKDEAAEKVAKVGLGGLISRLTGADRDFAQDEQAKVIAERKARELMDEKAEHEKLRR